MKVFPIYGRQVACDRDLELYSEEGSSDLHVVEGPVEPVSDVVHDLPDPVGDGRVVVWKTPRLTVEYDGWRFQTSAKRVVYAQTGPHNSPFDLVLERVVLPLQRLAWDPDTVAFHGASCIVGERAIVFLGASGAGKSTTARLVASARRGALASDDLSLIDARTMQLLPGGHGVRSVDPIEGVSGRELYPGSTKRWYDFPGRPPRPAPLALFVHLHRAKDWLVEEVRGSKAGVTLLTHCFDLQEPPTMDWSRSRLAATMKLARETPLLSVTYPADPDEPRHGAGLWQRLQPWLTSS